MKKSSFAIGSGGTNTWERINLAYPVSRLHCTNQKIYVIFKPKKDYSLFRSF